MAVATQERTPLTTAQAARLIGKTPAWVRVLAREGRLPAIETPLGRLFDPEDVLAVAERTTRTTRDGRG